MSSELSAYAGVGLGPRARRALSATLVVAALVLGALGVAPAASAAGGTATITGRVTGPGGAGLPDVAVSVTSPGVATTLTGADGRYSVSVPLPGSGSYYVTVCWGNQRGSQAGDPHVVNQCSYSERSVAAGGTLTVDHVARVGGVLSGQVTGQGAGALRDVRVDVYKVLGSGPPTRITTLRTDAAGRYSALLTPATYRLELRAGRNRGFADEFYDDAASLATATDVAVGRGDDVTADAQLRPEAGISGHVTPSRFAGPATGRSVVVYDTAGAVVRRARLDDDNDFAVLGLVPGSYRVAFNRLSGYAVDAAQFYNGKDEPTGLGGATAVQVTAGQQAAVAATLRRGGTIAGTLVDGRGTPLAGCRVQAYTRDGSLVTRLGLSEGNGDVEINGLATGSYYVRVLAPKHTEGDCDGERMWVTGASGGRLATAFTGARPVAVTQGSRTTLAADLVYATAGRVSGTVDLPSTALKRRDLTVVVRDTGTGDVAGTGHVDPGTGAYTVRGLSGGTYRVTFARVSGVATVEAQFYDGHPESERSGSADTFPVAFGQKRTGVDATLTPGNVLTGQVVGTRGDGLERCIVQAFTSSGIRVTRAALTDRDGRFEIGGLTTGKYKFRVVGKGDRRTECRGATQLYDGTSTLDADGPLQPPITIDQAATDLGTLTYTGERGGPTISGRVTFPSGSFSSDRYVVVRNLDSGKARRTRVGRDGTWSVAGLALGSYRVAYNRVSGYAWSAPQVHRNLPEASVASATPVTLDGTHRSATLSATLVEGRHVAGTLKDGEGNPLSCVVQAFTGDRHLVTRTGYSDERGRFRIDGLSPGSYKIRVVPSYGCDDGIQYLQAGSSTLSNQRSTFTVATVPIANGQVSLGTLVYGGTSLPELVNTAAPVVTGAPQVGATLTAAEGGWRPSATSYAYQWYAGGAAVGGARGRTFVPTDAQAGLVIAVQVTASRTGYAPTSRLSAPTAAVVGGTVPPVVAPPVAPGPLAFALAKKPSIKGKAVVGRTVKAIAGGTTPAAGTVSYQWLLDGKVIKGATKSKLKLSRATKGKVVSVRVTFASPGYTSLAVTSKKVKVTAPKPKGKG